MHEFNRVWIGIDNGPSGSIGIIAESKWQDVVKVYRVPTKVEQDYVKKKANVSRLDCCALRRILAKYVDPVRMASGEQATIAVLERPMVNPMRFVATKSALRFLEATLIVLEEAGISREFIDSREWQKALLPRDAKGPDLKDASLQAGRRLYPRLAERFARMRLSDVDGLLIAHYIRRRYHGPEEGRTVGGA